MKKANGLPDGNRYDDFGFCIFCFVSSQVFLFLSHATVGEINMCCVIDPGSIRIYLQCCSVDGITL
jgi:hypothetical protein